MDIFQKAKAVRLRCHHDKYLVADENGETVSQDRDGSCDNARWTVEIAESGGVVRLKSCYGRYLTASNLPLYLGVSGKKVLQTSPSRLGASVEWEPIRQGVKVRLRTRYGLFLRANGRLPPWRNTVTHDLPHRNSVLDWLLWDVDVLEARTPAARPPPNPIPNPNIHPFSPPTPPPYRPPDLEMRVDSYRRQEFHPPPPPPPELRIHSGIYDSFEITSSEFQNSVCISSSPPKERVVYYNMVDDDDGNVNKKGDRKLRSLSFKGKELWELKQRMEEKTGLHEDDFILCSRNLMNGKLCPLQSQLPFTNSDLYVVLVPSSSKVARTLEGTEEGVQW